jgi:type IV pilus assembly protein PilB
MIVSNEELVKILQENQLVSEDELKEAEVFAGQEKISLYEALVHQGLISDEQLGRLVADFLKVPFVSLSKTSINPEFLRIIPEVVAKKQQVIAFNKDPLGLHLAMADPSNVEVSEFIKKKVGLPVVVYLATEREVKNALNLYTKNIVEAFDEIIAKSVADAKGLAGAEPPIIKIVETIISYAYQNKASDVHIEPFEEGALVRFRIDGILHDIIKLPLELHPRVVARIKVLGKLRIDEHLSAQDGKIRLLVDKENLDIRVSIVPVTGGEKIVLRLLSERSRQFSLEDLGFSSEDFRKLKEAYEKPYGMILATGPTGSGKTTTMYSILKLLNKRDVNIMTIEDPVEYDLEGVNQIQVNPKTNLTFAAGLRSILRQDPNIILVGEIRDQETAGIAINAAMTGHLVLSTLHTNDAATSIPRLMDMNIEPFLIASTVNVIIAQRLVRKIHSVCRVSEELPVQDLKKLLGGEVVKKAVGEAEKIRVYRGKGCKVCHETGYEGRVGIFEVLLIDEEVREAILERKDAETIQKLAIKNGLATMMKDGLEKIKQGVTTVEEVARVTKE